MFVYRVRRICLHSISTSGSSRRFNCRQCKKKKRGYERGERMAYYRLPVIIIECRTTNDSETKKKKTKFAKRRHTYLQRFYAAFHVSIHCSLISLYHHRAFIIFGRTYRLLRARQKAQADFFFFVVVIFSVRVNLYYEL